MEIWTTSKVYDAVAVDNCASHGRASIPRNMDAVHASNTAGETPGCVLSHHMSVVVVVSWHVDIPILDGVHIPNPLH